MSNMATGIPVGLAIGIGSGIATGIASGQAMAKKAIAAGIRELAVDHHISVQKPDGGYLSLDEFIDLVVASEEKPVPGGNRRMILISVLIGLLAVAGAVLLIFLKLRS